MQRVVTLDPLMGYLGDQLAVGILLFRLRADPHVLSLSWDPYALQRLLCRIFVAVQHEHYSPAELCVAREAQEARQACIERPEVSENWARFHEAHERYKQQWEEPLFPTSSLPQAASDMQPAGLAGFASNELAVADSL